MTVSIDTIRSQYTSRRKRELNSEQQLTNFIKDSVTENVFRPYNDRRRMIASELITIGEKMKQGKIERDTALDLPSMQKLSYRYSAKDKKGLASALDAANNYQECVAIAQEFRNRNMHDDADRASQKADDVGYRGYLTNPEYRGAIKAINRAVGYCANDTFVVRDVDSVMDNASPQLIPIRDIILGCISEEPDAFDRRIAELVEKEMNGLPEVLDSTQIRTLRSLSE